MEQTPEGVLDALVQNNASFKAAFVRHDHVNDYCVDVSAPKTTDEAVRLLYGRHIGGYGLPGELDRGLLPGARIIDIFTSEYPHDTSKIDQHADQTAIGRDLP